MSYNKILDNDIKQIKKDIINIIELTKSQYAKTFEALKNKDWDLAKKVATDDKKINDSQNDFTKMALWKIAKQQMVAGDLRLAVGGILISREIERIADYAKGICNYGIKFNPEPTEIEYISKLFDLVNYMLNIISTMIEDFELSQLKKVLKIEEQINDEFNVIYKKIISKIIEEKNNNEDVTKTIQIIWQLKSLERAGDHLINVEEILQFIREGKFDEITSN